jgi:hypothetical protein
VAPAERLAANHYSEIGATVVRRAMALSEDLGFGSEAEPAVADKAVRAA